MIIEDETRAEVHPLTPAAIMRSADHRYTCGFGDHIGEIYPGVTGILGLLDKSGPLMSWAARQTAEAVMALISGESAYEYGKLGDLITAVGPEGFIKAVTSRSAWKRDEAANVGTEVHGLAELVVKGEPVPHMADPIRLRVMRYAEWWKASGWTLRLSEAMVIDPDAGYGGTFDLLARDRDGRTVLADIKTGKGVYREAVLQLAAYGAASWVAPQASPVAYPMPSIDRYVILHVTETEVREIEISIGDIDVQAFYACIALHEWAESRKGQKL